MVNESLASDVRQMGVMGGIQVNMICLSNVGLMLGQRRRQGPTLNQHWISWVISKKREYPYAICM